MNCTSQEQIKQQDNTKKIKVKDKSIHAWQ